MASRLMSLRPIRANPPEYATERSTRSERIAADRAAIADYLDRNGTVAIFDPDGNPVGHYAPVTLENLGKAANA